MELELQGKRTRNIVFIGEQGVGKSTLVNYFMNQQIDMTYLSTVGINYQIKTVKKKFSYDENGKNIVDNISKKNTVNNRKNEHNLDESQTSDYNSDSDNQVQDDQQQGHELQYELKIWDTSGQLQFQNLIQQQIKNIDCVILCFDLNDPVTLPNLEEDWVPFLQKIVNSNTNFILAGLKADLKKQKEQEEQELLQANGGKKQSEKNKTKKLNIKVIAKQSMQKLRKIFDLQQLQCLEVSVNNSISVQKLFNCDEMYFSKEQIQKMKIEKQKMKSKSLQSSQQQQSIQQNSIRNKKSKSQQNVISDGTIQGRGTSETLNEEEHQRECCKMCQIF